MTHHTLKFLLLLGLGLFSVGCGQVLSEIAKELAKGCIIDKEKYDQVPVFEPLDVNIEQNKLPPAVSLLQYAPRRASQGQQGSCTAWAHAYAARTILESASTGKNPNELIFSPAFVYNQIQENGCFKGSAMIDALNLMQFKGVASLNDFPYNPDDCTTKPNEQVLSQATQYKINNYTRISKSGDYYDLNLDALKQNIARGGVITIAMAVAPSFEDMYGKELWEPETGEAAQIPNYSGHAMCVIGYDDNKYGGALQIMNSWGTRWGQDGIFWVKYKDALTFIQEGYAIAPLNSNKQISQEKFQVALGFQKVENNQLTNFINFRQLGSNFNFFNKTPLRKGDRFKIVFENSKDCYVYIFGLDVASEGSFTIFPYAKTSPYFGISGVRTFPKNKSFTIDADGDYDYMSVLISKKPLDAKAINAKINRNMTGGKYYFEWVQNAIKSELVDGVTWGNVDNVLRFDGDRSGKNALLLCFQISKQ
jgi:hypothetical protein